MDDANAEKDLNVRELTPGNVFELVALVNGLDETIWQGGVFQVYMKFEPSYNQTAPSVHFQTIPFHPNVHMITGRPSLDFLDDASKWKPGQHSIKYVLKSMQQLLANPLLDLAVNMDAVFLLKDSPSEYESVVKQSIEATKRIRDILAQKKKTPKLGRPESNDYVSTKDIMNDLLVRPASLGSKQNSFPRFPLFKIAPFQITRNKENFGIASVVSSRVSNHNRKDSAMSSKSEAPRVKNVSFDDYSKLWTSIATTKSVKDEQNLYLNESLINNPSLLAQHISISLNDLEEQVYRQLTEHRNLMYGKFNFDNKPMRSGSAGGDNGTVNMIKHGHHNAGRAVNYNDLNKRRQQADVKKVDDLDQDFEEEVDQLINWTKNI